MWKGLLLQGAALEPWGEVGAPATVLCDKKSVFINATKAGSTLSEKCLTIAYHFCRENFSSEVVGARWVDSKHNLAAAMTRSLMSEEFHSRMRSAMSNYKA